MAVEIQLLVLSENIVGCGVLVLLSIFQPFMVTYFAYKSFTESDVSEAATFLWFIKLFKALEVLLEAIPRCFLIVMCNLFKLALTALQI